MGFPQIGLQEALVFDVRAYGAVGDGVQDDTAAGNLCIADAAAVGGTAYFPEGTYLGEFVSPTQSTGYVRIMGAGIDATTLLCKENVSADGAALSLNMPGEIVDCTVDGNGTVVPSTTTYSVLSVGNGLDAGWDFCALRRVRARNINPSVPNNGWNLVVWLSNASAPSITDLTLEDVIVEGPSASNFDAMAINSFVVCRVSNMSLLNLTRSPNFYQGDSLVINGLYSNGATGIASLVIDSGVTRATASQMVIDPTFGTAELSIGTPLFTMDSSMIGNGGNAAPGPTGACVLNMSGTSQKSFISNSILKSGMSISSTVALLAIQGSSLYAGPAGNMLRCDLGASGSGPIVCRDVDFVAGNSGSQITYAETAGTVFPLVIDGGRLDPASDFNGILGPDSVAGSPFSVRNLTGYNPVGSSVPGTAFALPASGTAWTNNTGVDGTLWVTAAGTVTDVVLQGVTVGSSLAVGQSFFVPAGGTITFTYSAAPTLVFVGN